MKLKWLGTAGFLITSHDQNILIDPYVTRNKKARPEQPLQPSDIADVNAIFISHGHFDHISDVPAIASQHGTGVYCGSGICETLVQKGVKRDQIIEVSEDGKTFDLEGIHAQAFLSQHIKFDLLLLIQSLARINFRLPYYLPLAREYPVGQVLSWRFTIEGKNIHHFGSAGSSAKELSRLNKHHTDVLLVPLQGHSNICTIALEYVKALKPKLVIPHHQDDFFPPISTLINIQPFVDSVRQACHATEIKVLEINETVIL